MAGLKPAFKHFIRGFHAIGMGHVTTLDQWRRLNTVTIMHIANGIHLYQSCLTIRAVNRIVSQSQLCDAGAVNGVQGSLVSFFGSASFLAGVVSPEPEKFGRLTAASWTVVFVSAVLYSLWNMLFRSQESKHVASEAEVNES